jgi:hypothetical protein
MEDLTTYTVFYKEDCGHFECIGTFDSKLKVYEAIKADFDAELDIEDTYLTLAQWAPREEIRTVYGDYIIAKSKIKDQCIIGIIE